jgi:arylsulfatase A-like enzyme
MADDHCRQATSCYAGKKALIQTPQIDRLAREGVRFNHALVGNSYCSPSRAAMLTGKYNHLCGVRRLQGVFDGAQQTFPKLLQQAGYQTALVGKWHLASQPTGFDFYSVMVDHGNYYDCLLNETGGTWGNRGEKGAVVHKGYLTDVITDVSLQWLEQRDAGKPFCLMIHHKAPHGPHYPAPRHKKLFDDVDLPEPPNLLDDWKGRAPEPLTAKSQSSLLTNPYPEYQHLRKKFTGDRAHDTRVMYQAFMKGYLRLIAALDENIGRVLDHLDKTGLAKNTIVIYTSDNGFFNGEHGFFNKMWMYEESLHIPMIVRAPGASAGRANDELVSMIDVAPTVLDLAGVKVPGDMQGASMKPLLQDKPGPWRDAFYYRFYGVEGERPGSPDWLNHGAGIIGVRTKTGKLVFYPQWGKQPFWEYFDLTTDPTEMRNLYGEPSRRDEVAALKARLRELAAHYRDMEVVQQLDAEKKEKP